MHILIHTNQLDKKAPSHEGTKQPYDILKDELLSYIRSYIHTYRSNKNTIDGSIMVNTYVCMCVLCVLITHEPI